MSQRIINKFFSKRLAPGPLHEKEWSLSVNLRNKPMHRIPGGPKHKNDFFNKSFPSPLTGKK